MLEMYEPIFPPIPLKEVPLTVTERQAWEGGQDYINQVFGMLAITTFDRDPKNWSKLRANFQKTVAPAINEGITGVVVCNEGIGRMQVKERLTDEGIFLSLAYGRDAAAKMWDRFCSDFEMNYHFVESAINTLAKRLTSVKSNNAKAIYPFSKARKQIDFSTHFPEARVIRVHDLDSSILFAST